MSLAAPITSIPEGVREIADTARAPLRQVLDDGDRMRAISVRDGDGSFLQLRRTRAELIPHVIGHAHVEQVLGREAIENRAGDTCRNPELARNDCRVPPARRCFHERHQQRELLRRCNVAVHERQGGERNVI